MGNPVIKRLAKQVLRRRLAATVHHDLEPAFLDIYAQCQAFTMTSIERMYALYQGIQYVVKRDIPGDFVECGVWKGGSAMLMAKTLIQLERSDRTIYLYDTYAGMAEPGEYDVSITGKRADKLWAQSQRDGANGWCYESLPHVRQNLLRTAYPEDRLQFVRGPVEETIPGVMPERIALLRLDTDWYESTRHELTHLYPRLTTGGILLIDDYGHWQGARQAVDEYFRDHASPLMLSRIDYTGRIAVKA
jgi:O-methyltransferase